MTTQSTSEAMAVLKATRRALIDAGREIAHEICKLSVDQTVTSREVRRVMAERGLLPPGEKEFWLGAIFNCDEFEWTGRMFSYIDSERNIHERTVKVWKSAA